MWVSLMLPPACVSKAVEGSWGYSCSDAHRDLITLLATVHPQLAPCAVFQLACTYNLLTVRVYSMCECDLGLDFSTSGKVLHFASRSSGRIELRFRRRSPLSQVVALQPLSLPKYIAVIAAGSKLRWASLMT